MRGQTELIGLAVIAVLLIAGMLLMPHRNSVQITPTQERGLLTAMLRTEVSCGELVRVSDLLRECRTEDCRCRDATLDGLLHAAATTHRFELHRNGKEELVRATGDCPITSTQRIPDKNALEARFGTC